MDALSSIVDPDHGQLFWLPVGERFQEDSIDHAEDRGVGSDAECEGEYGDRGKAGVAAEVAWP